MDVLTWYHSSLCVIFCREPPGTLRRLGSSIDRIKETCELQTADDCWVCINSKQMKTCRYFRPLYISGFLVPRSDRNISTRKIYNRFHLLCADVGF